MRGNTETELQLNYRGQKSRHVQYNTYGQMNSFIIFLSPVNNSQILQGEESCFIFPHIDAVVLFCDHYSNCCTCSHDQPVDLHEITRNM